MTDETSEFIRPFPALTPAQRYHLDVFGYVVVENTLSTDEVGTLLEAMQQLQADLEAAGEGAFVRGCRFSAHHPHHSHLAHILEAHPAIYDYLTHPRLVGLVEELVGGTVRLEESEAVINSRAPDSAWDGHYGFHTGTRPDIGTYVENGLYHCTFVKTLTNLTDLGPDDPVNQPEYIQALTLCAAKSGIVDAMQEFQSSRVGRTPEQIREDNEQFIELADCLRGKGWTVSDPIPDADGSLGPGEDFASPDGDLAIDDIRDCISERNLSDGGDEQ